MTLEAALSDLAPRVLRYCVGYMGDRSLGEEVAQESLTVLVKAWRTTGPPTNPDAFVFTVAKRRARRVLFQRSVLLPQRAQQDAEAAVQDLQQQVNGELERAITPLLEQVAVDKRIHLLVRADTGAVAWADPALDLTGEIIKRLDAATPRPPKAP